MNPNPMRENASSKDVGAVRKPMGRRILYWLLGVTGAAALFPLFLLLALYLYLQMFQLILPGVRVAGAPVDGLMPLEAEAELDRIWNQEYLITAVDAMSPADAWLVDPGEFGLEVDAAATARTAYAVGRGGGLFANLGTLWEGLRHGWDLEPTVVLDDERARAGLSSWAEALDEVAVEGDVHFVSGEVVPVSGQDGKRLDIEATLLLLAGDPYAVMVDYRFLPLLTMAVEPSVTNVEDAAAQARRYLQGSFQLTGFDPVSGEDFDWTPPPEALAAWVQIERLDEVLTVSIDAAAVASYLDGIDDTLGNERTVLRDDAQERVLAAFERGETVSLRAYYLPTEYTVRSTDNIITIAFAVGMPYWRIYEANPMLAVHGLPVGETIEIPPRDINLVVPPVENKRIVVSISDQHMWTYEDGQLRSDHVVSTGMANSPTMPGVFQVQIHIVNAYGENWDLYMPHFLGIYEAVPGFMNGIHGLPLLSSGVRLWADVLGSPASYGCIILDLAAAEDVYNWAENGVVVEILP